MTSAKFPNTRLRRLRQEGWIRDLVQETRFTPQNLIWPMFVIDGKKTKEPISSMPGVDRYSVDLAVEKAKQAYDAGIPVVALFPRTDPKLKNDQGSEALNPDNLVCQAVQAIKKAVPKLGIMCDVA
ncbi:MAG: porphobilinogen synthase, partial [Proteobacteria bacterium]|nr:porphobilinogen synthase [Pseudomonadota bacterium]